MRGRDFLTVAVELAKGTTTAYWRSAVGRAYYALLLEGRDALLRWGFSPPRGDRIHAWVRLRFTYAADQGLKTVGLTLDDLVRSRNAADYDMLSKSFRNDNEATTAIVGVQAALAELDTVAADPVRRAAAIADIKAKWP